MENDKGGGPLANPGLIWITIVAAGAFLAHEVPWQGSRPVAADAKAYPYVARENIDARLWQDPISAVARGRESIGKPAADGAGAASDRHGSPADGDEHAMAALGREVREKGCGAGVAPLIVGVMIPGGSYPESVEVRRRMRYAVLAGMHRMGYAPDDAEHIGYVLPHPKNRGDAPEFVAYEWLSTTAKAGNPLLAVWLDEDAFGTDTLKRLELFDELRKPIVCPGARPVATAGASVPQSIVVGPSYTRTLQDMLRHAKTIGKATGATMPTFYAYGATAADGALQESVGYGQPNDTVHDVFEAAGMRVYRTIGPDDALARALQAELFQRGVDPASHYDCARDRQEGRDQTDVDHVVLIFERDTFYGRSLSELMTDQFRGTHCGPTDRLPYLHRFSYLRGLDGQLPTQGAGPEGGRAKGADKNESGAADRTAKEGQIEHPEGQSQFDYLRRLSVELASLDLDLRRKGGGTIRAIGVLGSDVYDKLVILQALHSQFADAVFFTTDLDARMMHPQEQEWARNLIVASNFGLDLRRSLQGDVFPFRDGYQTSAFLSTQIALYNAARGCVSSPETADCIGQAQLDNWLARPRVFEIGRNTLVDLSETVPEADRSPSGDCDNAGRFADCKFIHPREKPLFVVPTSSAFRDGVLLVVLGGVLLALAKGFGTRLHGWVTEGRGGPLTILAVGAGAALLFALFGRPLWIGLAVYLTGDGKGEPISILNGTSLWPSEGIRLLSLVLSLTFVVWAWHLLNVNLREIAHKMRFEPDHDAMVALVRDEYRTQWSVWRRMGRAFSFRLIEYSGGPGSQQVGLSWRAQRFWKKYIYQGRGFARGCRVGAAVIVFSIVAVAVVAHFGWPDTPYRGHASKLWNGLILMTSSGAMLFVIFFVVDATVFCHQIVQALKEDLVHDDLPAPLLEEVPTDSLWAEGTLRHYKDKFNLEGRYLDAWILIDFIAMRTKVVARLIYFPFIVISLMVLARSSFFDRWNMPLGLAIVFGSAVLIVAGCAILLRESAEDARRRVLRLLSDDLIRLKGDEGRTGHQIEAMIEQVRELKEGAFAPYSQQPVFRALLLPLSTFGGSALLDYLTASSF